jgi:TonB family protein
MDYIYSMTKFFLIVLFAGLYAPFAVRGQDTLWYDASWAKSTVADASFFRTKVKTDSGCLVTDHFRNGKIQMTGGYADGSFHVKQGEFRWYDEGGIVDHVCTYSKGKTNGIEIIFYENGRQKAKGVNRDDQRDGEWTAYFPSGKLAGKANFQAGKRVSMRLFHEDGSLNNKDTILQRESEFPGGIPQYLRFLNKTLRYPDSAVVYEIQGIVVVQFKVSKEGKVSELKVVQSVNKYLDAEALRVLGLTPDWNPAIVAGVPIDSYHIQPVIFSLQTQ